MNEGIAMNIGKIVKSVSHISYVCQIFGTRETEAVLAPADYAFGRFVRVGIRSGAGDDDQAALEILTGQHEPTTYAIGVIYDTILSDPAYGALGPRLSNETQVELFTPDYINEKAVYVHLMILGLMEQRAAAGGSFEIASTMHGVPPLSLELGSEVETMSDGEVRAFHFFRDPGRADRPEPYLHMGYVPHIIAQPSRLLPVVTLTIIDQLERLFPQHLSLLSIVKRNFAWRLKVETTG